MDGENNGKPYCLMDDLGGPPIVGNIHLASGIFQHTPNSTFTLDFSESKHTLEQKNSQPFVEAAPIFWGCFQKSHPKLPLRVFLTQQTSQQQLRGSHFDDGLFLGRSGSICWSSMKLIFSRQAWECSWSATGCAIRAAIPWGKCRKHHPVGGCW